VLLLPRVFSSSHLQEKQEQAIENAYTCDNQWPFLKKLHIVPTTEGCKNRFDRLNNEGKPLADSCAFQIPNYNAVRLANTIASFFDKNHMTSWQRYRTEFYVNFRSNWADVAGDDLMMMLTWFDPPNTDDVPYGIGFGIDSTARLFINTHMTLMLDMFGWEQQLRVVVEMLQGCHMACWQTVKWELQRATARHRECQCESCCRRQCIDPRDSDFAELSLIALGSSSRLEHNMSREPFMKRFTASLARPRH
jgi:hypothetical protein